MCQTLGRNIKRYFTILVTHVVFMLYQKCIKEFPPQYPGSDEFFNTTFNNIFLIRALQKHCRSTCFSLFFIIQVYIAVGSTFEIERAFQWNLCNIIIFLQFF